MNDVKFALRQLLKNPGFTAVAVLTLAFSIGANTVIFGLINTVLFTAPMARHGEQLAALYQQDRTGANPGQWRHFSYPDFVDLRANHYVFADMAAEDQALVGFRDCGLNEMVPACVVSANYFSMLGVPPILGRGFLPEEETSSAPAAVLTHAFWERLGSNPTIIGHTLKLSRGFATVVGVMPRGFTGDRLAAPSMFLSLGAEEMLNSQPNQTPAHTLSDRTQRLFTIVARLKEGLTVKTAMGLLSVLNQKLANQCWPGTDPIGQTLQVPTRALWSRENTWRAATVIGVVANIDWNLFDQQHPAEFYEPTAGQFAGSVWNLHVRVGPCASADRLMASCNEALRQFDNRIPVPQIRTLSAMQRTNPQVMLMELGGLLFSIFGAVAMFLSFLGVYGLKAYEVTRRTREIGIRMTLGATAANVLTMVLRGSAGLALWGMGVGLLLSLAVGRLASRFLYRVQPFDPLTFFLVPMALLGVVLFACFIPARRAAKVDPMEALRYE